MKITDSYYNNARSSMLGYIPSSAKRILEIGCATGRFGHLIKKESDAEIWGVEINEVAGKLASEVLDRVLIMPVEKSLDKLPANALASIMAARSEHFPVLSAQTELPGVLSIVSAVVFTIKT